MKSKIISHVVAVMATIVLFATVAQAGSHGVAPFQAFFECHAIQSGNSNLEVNIDGNQFREQEPVRAKLGNAVLVCTGVEVSERNPDGTSGAEIAPLLGDHLKCYTVATDGPRITPQNKTLTDALVGADAVKVSDSRLLCGTATKGE